MIYYKNRGFGPSRKREIRGLNLSVVEDYPPTSSKLRITLEFTSDRVAILATRKVTTNRKVTTLGGARDRLEDVRCQDSLIMENIKNKYDCSDRKLIRKTFNSLWPLAVGSPPLLVLLILSTLLV